MNALLAAPAFALALAACAGGDGDVSSQGVSVPETIVEADTSADTTSPEPDSASSDESSGDDAVSESDGNESDANESDADTDAISDESSAAAEAPAANTIQKLSAEEAIANAEVNQPNLASSDNVLDIETLAVADGSIQTLRDVVDGDRPVLLWFFSPH